MRHQRGFALFELLLAAAVALLIAAWAAQALFNRVSDAGAQQSARWMLMVRGGVHSYLVAHAEQLRWAAGPLDLAEQGYQDWTAPQLSELKSGGLLDTGFPERMRPVDSIGVRVWREGACPGAACRIGALIHSQRPFQKTAGIIDEQMLAQWLLGTEGLGGIVHPSQPDVIRGHTFQHSNPFHGGPVLPAGTVAMSISNDQLAQSGYLRVRDDRDPQFQSDATIEGDVVAGGVVSAGQHLHLGSSARWLDPCASEGAVTRDQSRGLLVCSGGHWHAADHPSGGYSINSRYGCYTSEGRSTANPVTRACSCPAGHASVPISEGVGSQPEHGVTHGFLCVR